MRVSLYLLEISFIHSWEMPSLSNFNLVKTRSVLSISLPVTETQSATLIVTGFSHHRELKICHHYFYFLKNSLILLDIYYLNACKVYLTSSENDSVFLLESYFIYKFVWEKNSYLGNYCHCLDVSPQLSNQDFMWFGR